MTATTPAAAKTATTATTAVTARLAHPPASARDAVRRAGRAAAATAVLAVAATACNVSHPGITNGAVSGCFKALPAARTAVHDRGARLIGVHRLAADQVRSRLPANLPTPAELDTTVCAVAFQGPFRAGQVAMARPDATGRYAVVLVNAKKLDIVASYVGDRLPKNLRGRTV